MLDSIVFEQHGMPSASIITDVFKVTGRAMARSWGVPEFRFVAMPHPIANLTDAELDQRAEAIVPEVVRLLLEGQTN
ncbi:MAG: hypothetical protein A3F74_10905 [Betaproteobacteria bacterium RIFCSPLOWO2_12_FULL_62_58]|nr:MAG: hypothetical protein A3F74_10905 [Betaproteobacteria bacterium RIFCSPLOWO2_12_FULL_62_58]